MRFRSVTAVGLFGLTVFAAGAGAAPVHYQESVSGDLPTLATGITLNFDAGVNTVQGNASIGEYDSFGFTIPVGYTLGDISYTFSNGGTGSLIVHFSSTLSPFSDVLDVNVVGASPVNATGLFQSLVQQFAVECMACSNASWNYTWSFTVDGPATVPEPSSVALAGIALAGLGVARRRRKASR